MKKDILKLGMGVSVLFAVTACDKNDGGGETPAGKDKITVTAGIEALTRAPHLNEDGSGYFTAGDLIAMTVTGGGKTVQTVYKVDGNLYWEDLDLPAETTEATFTGCYPKPASASDNKFTFDLSTAKDKDLLLAPGVKVSKRADTKVKLAFRHAMHKLVLNYASDGTYSAEQLGAAKTTCSAKSSCEVDMMAATIGRAGTKTSAFDATGKTVHFLLVPQASDEVTLRIEIGEAVIEHTLIGLNDVLKNQNQNIPATLDGGKCLTLNLTFGKDGIVVDSSEIGGWEDQGTIDGEIEV